MCHVKPLGWVIGSPLPDHTREVVFGLLLHVAELELRLDPIRLICISQGSTDLVRERSENRIFERIRVLVENDVGTVTEKFDFLTTTDVAVNRVEVGMNVELSIAGQAENVRWPVVHEV